MEEVQKPREMRPNKTSCCYGVKPRLVYQSDSEISLGSIAAADEQFEYISPIRRGYVSFRSIPDFDAYYGNVPGVLRTRVGFMSRDPNTTRRPSSWCKLGFCNVVEIEYDPMLCDYRRICSMFYHYCDPNEWSQVRHVPILFYSTKTEMHYAKDQLVERNKDWGLVGLEVKIHILQASAFYEDVLEHQKPELQRDHPLLMEMLGLGGRQIVRSHIACKVQAYMKTLGGLDQWNYEIEHDLKDCISPAANSYVRNHLLETDPIIKKDEEKAKAFEKKKIHNRGKRIHFGRFH